MSLLTTPPRKIYARKANLTPDMRDEVTVHIPLTTQPMNPVTSLGPSFLKNKQQVSEKYKVKDVTKENRTVAKVVTKRKPSSFSDRSLVGTRKRFSKEEKECIVKGVSEFHRIHNKWSAILGKYRTTFHESRTSVDIKDCYRNLVRYQNASPLTPSRGLKIRAKWSDEEKQAVVAGVQLFGVGAWVQTKMHFWNVLRHRSNVQIKDCWRTIQKHHPDLAFKVKQELEQETLVHRDFLSPAIKQKLKATE